MKYLLPGILVMFLVIIIGAGAFVLGERTTNPTIIKPTITPILSNKIASNSSVNETMTPTQTKQKEIAAGGVLSFPRYTILISDGWISEREQGQDTDKLTLSKLGYKITISEGAFGGSGCLYPGDDPSEMAQVFTSFVEIINPNGYVFRRSSTDKSGWTVCQKGSDESFGAPTIFGHISITASLTPNIKILTEIDTILASLKKTLP